MTITCVQIDTDAVVVLFCFAKQLKQAPPVVPHVERSIGRGGCNTVAAAGAVHPNPKVQKTDFATTSILQRTKLVGPADCIDEPHLHAMDPYGTLHACNT